jgi:hypothetical protein
MQRSTAVAINAQADVFAYERLLYSDQLPEDSDSATNRTSCSGAFSFMRNMEQTCRKHQGLCVILMLNMFDRYQHVCHFMLCRTAPGRHLALLMAVVSMSMAD